MYTITKKFTDYPFAHRQWRHDGHCQHVHGHNWDFEITLGSPELDEVGFVYDFGQFKVVKQWLELMFDHTLVLCEDDPHLKFLSRSAEHDGDRLWDIVVVPGGSAEQLAEFIYNQLKKTIEEPVEILTVTVYESPTNSATYYEY